MKGAFIKIKTYKLFELDLPVSIWVNSKNIPEYVVQLLLRYFIQNFNQEGFNFWLD